MTTDPVDQARDALEVAPTYSTSPDGDSQWVLVPRKPSGDVIEGICRANAPRPKDWPDAYDEEAQIMRRANAECSYLEVISGAGALPVRSREEPIDVETLLECLDVETLESWLGAADPDWRVKLQANLKGLETTEYAVRDIAAYRKWLSAEVMQLREGQPNADPAQATGLQSVQDSLQHSEDHPEVPGVELEVPFETVEASPGLTEVGRAALAWVLFHHQGAGSPVGQPIRLALGLGQHERLPDTLIAQARLWAEMTGASTADFKGGARQDERAGATTPKLSPGKGGGA